MTHLLSLREVRRILRSAHEHPRAIAHKIGCSFATVERVLANPAKYLERAAKADVRRVDGKLTDCTPFVKKRFAKRCPDCGALTLEQPCLACKIERSKYKTGDQ